MVHKERIIQGIEEVLKGYGKDKEFKEALRESGFTFSLFPKFRGEKYLFNNTGEIYFTADHLGYVGVCPPRRAAESYFDYFLFNSKPPITLTKAKAMLEADLGQRVETLKKSYAQHFDQECDRQAENRYAEHPGA